MSILDIEFLDLFYVQKTHFTGQLSHDDVFKGCWTLTVNATYIQIIICVIVDNGEECLGISGKWL